MYEYFLLVIITDVNHCDLYDYIKFYFYVIYFIYSYALNLAPEISPDHFSKLFYYKMVAKPVHIVNIDGIENDTIMIFVLLSVSLIIHAVKYLYASKTKHFSR